MPRQDRSRRCAYVVAAAGIRRLRLDQRFSIEDSVTVKQLASRSDEFLKPQIEGAVEIPEVRVPQVGEGPDWVAHAGLIPVTASASLRTDGVIPPKTTRRSLYTGRRPVQRTNARARMVGG